jgi:tripartite-type tricarboxylate transporter receptor subunit TctC
MSRLLGQSVVVENRAGAGGAVGHAQVARAAPDGYTVMMALSSIVAIPVADEVNGRQPTYRMSDFTPIALVSADPTVLMVPAGAKWKSLKDLVDDAKANPGKISYSSSGLYGTTHTAAEMFAQAAAIQLLHVPYKGGAPAAAAVAAGDVHFGVMAAPGAIPHIKSGRGKVIGITTAKKSPLDPSWATPRDAGIPDLDASIWVGLFAPKGTPQPVVERINAEVRKTLEVPDVRKRFVESGGAEAVGMTPAEFLARIKSDAERYKRVVQKAGVKPG